MTIEDKKIISDMLVSWIGVCGLLVGAGWTLVEYYGNKDKEESQHTLKYVTAFNSGELFKAQTLIAETWSSNSQKLEALIEAGDESKLAEFVVNTANKESVRNSIWIVIDFYESLATCVKEEICSKGNALEFFGERSLRFYNLHHYFIEATRQELGDDKYAKRLQGFASTYYESK